MLVAQFKLQLAQRQKCLGTHTAHQLFIQKFFRLGILFFCKQLLRLLNHLHIIGLDIPFRTARPEGLLIQRNTVAKRIAVHQRANAAVAQGQCLIAILRPVFIHQL